MTAAVFSPSFGNRPSHLIGREGVIQTFMGGFAREPGNRDRAIVLLGQRGSGKTVLLWELADRAADLGFVVATPTTTSENMLQRIVEKLQLAAEPLVKQPEAKLTGGSIEALGFSVGLQFDRIAPEPRSFQFQLAQLTRQLNELGHGVLILIDELQANSAEVRQLVAAYQELVGERMDIALVLAGLPGAVSATLNDRVLTFLNRARKVELGPLATSEIDAFYQRAFAELNIGLPGDLRLAAARATQGSPYLLQLIGYNLTLRVPSGGTVTQEVLDGALAASAADFENDVCRTTLAALSSRDIDFLVAMAQDGGASKISDIADRMGATSDYAQKYRRRLINAGVIAPAGRGMVAFSVPYLGDFLRRELES